jgi:hypothetical protein
VNLILSDLNLVYEKRRENSCQHRNIFDEWLKAITILDFIQVVKEPTWERIHNNNIPKSILNYVYVDDMSTMETINVDKQPISNHFLVYVTSSGKKKRTKFSKIEYQCWKNYSQETLKTKLKKTDFCNVLKGSAQQIFNKLDYQLRKILDLLTPIVCSTVRNDRFEPSFITKEKKKVKNLHKKAKNQVSNFDEKMQNYKNKGQCTDQKENKIKNEAILGPNNL